MPISPGFQMRVIIKVSQFETLVNFMGFRSV